MATTAEKLQIAIDAKKQMQRELMAKGYSASEVGSALANIPQLMHGLGKRQEELPDWFKKAIVCWYDVKRQGCTNENMKAMETQTGRAKLLDLSGNKNDLELRNFAWNENSGVEQHCINFRRGWAPTTLAKMVVHETNKLTITLQDAEHAGRSGAYVWSKGTSIFPQGGQKMRVKVTDLTPGLSFDIVIISWMAGGEKRICKLDHNGEYEVILPPFTDSLVDNNHALAFYTNNQNTKCGSITLEILPEHPNSLVFDGKDDIGVCETLPLLQDYTVMSDIFNQQSVLGVLYLLTSKEWGGTVAKSLCACHTNSMNPNALNPLSTVSFGVTSLVNQTHIHHINVQTPLSFNNFSIKKGTQNYSNSLSLYVGATIPKAPTWCAKAVFKYLLIFNRTLSNDEMDWVRYNLMDEELPEPVAGWTAKGRSNSEKEIPGNTGHSILHDMTGKGHHIQLKNFDFQYSSGYGGYFNTFKRGKQKVWNVVNNFVNFPDDYTAIISKETPVTDGPSYLYCSEVDFSHLFRFYVEGFKQSPYSDVCFTWTDANNVRQKYFFHDGINEFYATGLSSSANILVYNTGKPLNDDLKIRFLPSYPDGLVFDGVDDWGVCENMPLFTKEKGYTVISRRKILSLQTKSTRYVASKSKSSYKGAFIHGEVYSENGDIQTREGYWSFGKGHQLSVPDTIGNIFFQTSKYYNTTPVNQGVIDSEWYDNPELFIGTLRQNSLCCNMVLYDLYVFDHDLTPSAIEAFVRKNIDPEYRLHNV